MYCSSPPIPTEYCQGHCFAKCIEGVRNEGSNAVTSLKVKILDTTEGILYYRCEAIRECYTYYLYIWLYMYVQTVLVVFIFLDLLPSAPESSIKQLERTISFRDSPQVII